MAFFSWRGKAWSVSVPLGLVGLLAVAVIAVVFWLRG